MLDHPVACLVAASTTDKKPLACLQELCNPHHFPTAFQRGQFDLSVPVFFLLVHDVREGAGVDPEALLERMRTMGRGVGRLPLKSHTACRAPRRALFAFTGSSRGRC